MSKIIDYLQDIKDCSDEVLNDIQDAILTLDEVTDIKEGPDNDIGVSPVSDVADQMEISVYN